MSGYTKLFASILDSTVWQTSQATRLVWITMLAMADKDGVVEGSIPGLAKRAGVSLPEAEDALECFMSPDPYSRTKDYEGRRIEEVDGGWRLLNHRKHRDKLSKVEQNEKAAERMRARRSEKANNREQPRTTANTSEQFANVRDVRHADADTSPDAEERETRASAPPSEPAAVTPDNTQNAPRSPSRFRQPLEDAVRAEFFARHETPQKAADSQWRDGCQTVQDGLQNGWFSDAHEVIAAFASLVVDACTRREKPEKLGFALQQTTLSKPAPAAPAMVYRIREGA